MPSCRKCLTGRTGDVVGELCRTPGCGGTIEVDQIFGDQVDDLPGTMTCGRRWDGGFRDPAIFKIGASIGGKDRWQKFKLVDNRVCSYCGSLHPDDLFRLVKECGEAPIDAPYGSVSEIEPSDKGYKIYVHQPGVRNAMEGGIKFYTQHLPRNEDGSLAVSEERQAEYSCAVKATRARFNAHLANIRKR